MLFPFQAEEVEEILIQKPQESSQSSEESKASQKSQAQARSQKKQDKKNKSQDSAPLTSYLFKKEKEDWILEASPEKIKDWADTEELKGMLRQLTREKHISIASEEEALNWAIYGLEGSLLSVFVRLSSKETYRILIGRKNEFSRKRLFKKGSKWNFRAKNLYGHIRLEPASRERTAGLSRYESFKKAERRNRQGSVLPKPKRILDFNSKRWALD